jgi:predicted dehydrogenase
MTMAPDLGSPLHPGKSTAHRPVRFGCVGLGGYAEHICGLLQEYGNGEAAPVQLAAVWDPEIAAHEAKAASLRAAGVRIFSEYEELLSDGIEALWLPVPIDLHRSYTLKALAAGKAVMCEKPAAGSVDDVDAMIAARDRAELPVAIGYQDIYDPITLQIKRQLLDGEIGTIQSVVVWGCWPRSEAYFGRSAWAGRFQRDGTWILDSPANNAMSHFINLALFLVGPTERESAQPLQVEAELYRANDIENYDTCGLRIMAPMPVLVLLTHACATLVEPHIELHGSAGRLRYQAFESAEIHGRRGRQHLPLDAGGVRGAMVDRFARWIRGSLGSDLVATLEVARAPVVTINGASEATPVVQIPDAHRKDLIDRGSTLRTIDGIEAAFERCAAAAQMPHESGQCPWSSPPGTRDLRGYNHFAGPRV